MKSASDENFYVSGNFYIEDGELYCGWSGVLKIDGRRVKSLKIKNYFIYETYDKYALYDILHYVVTEEKDDILKLLSVLEPMLSEPGLNHEQLRQTLIACCEVASL